MEHNTKVKNFISPEQDTLTADWQGRYCWMNPPYSNPLPFVLRAIQQSVLHNKTVVMLLNVDGSTKWFDMCVRNAKRNRLYHQFTYTFHQQRNRRGNRPKQQTANAGAI